MKRILWLLLFSGCCLTPVNADVYHIDAVEMINGQKVDGNGTAVCVATAEGKSLLLTAKHIVQNSHNNTWVAVKGKWILAFNVRFHPTADLATLEVNSVLNPTPIGDDPHNGDKVVVAGYGPLLQKQSNEVTFTGAIDDTSNEIYTLTGTNGLHAMPGDSGGAVISKDRLVGIVSWHGGNRPATSRKFYSRQVTKCKTGFVGHRTIT